ncbi:MAG: hypothetical protein EU549_02125 [Promethearchaeota archaeon]|nr:MAG: hypothetical protein EU549_02125 [Candidatus Lokiarchaeota archaeon]
MTTPNEWKLKDDLVKFRNLLTNSKNLNNEFLINSEIKNSRLFFSIKEKKPYKRRTNPREILLTVSFNPEFYSIKSFVLNNNQKNRKNPNQLYSIKIEGNNNIAEIFKNLNDIIRGKDQTIFKLNHPYL